MNLEDVTHPGKYRYLAPIGGEPQNCEVFMDNFGVLHIRFVDEAQTMPVEHLVGTMIGPRTKR